MKNNSSLGYIYEDGLVVGKFAPLTLGHINLINIAAMECKNLTVVLCFNSNFLEKQNQRDKKVLTLRNRLYWLKKTYSSYKNISIKFIDETNIPAYPNGWQEYANLLRGVFGGEIKKGTVIFSSENEYDENYKKYLPETVHQVVDNDRKDIPISATMIRNSIYENWKMIPSIVRSAYALKVCFISPDNIGQTDLVRYLAKLYNTSWTEDYFEEYCEQELSGNKDLLIDSDYLKIAFKNKVLEDEAIKSSNKICFIDSSAFTTDYHCRAFNNSLNPILLNMSLQEEYDLIIYLDNNINFNLEKKNLWKI